jgi:hypothetical protein
LFPFDFSSGRRDAAQAQASLFRFPKPMTRETTIHQQGEQNGCRQRLEGYLSCQQHLSLAVA